MCSWTAKSFVLIHIRSVQLYILADVCASIMCIIFVDRVIRTYRIFFGDFDKLSTQEVNEMLSRMGKMQRAIRREPKPQYPWILRVCQKLTFYNNKMNSVAAQWRAGNAFFFMLFGLFLLIGAINANLSVFKSVFGRASGDQALICAHFWISSDVEARAALGKWLSHIPSDIF